VSPRRDHDEDLVRYGALRTPWGRLWAARSDEGVVAVALGAEPVGRLAAEVERRRPGRLVHDAAAVAPLLADLAAFLAGRRDALERWSLDTTGLSPFRVQVYESARKIPYGTRIAYRDLAKQFASARYAHAVGAALAENPYRLLVPDHRVILARGKAGGFRMGRGWKARLLALESGQTALEWANGEGRRG